MLTAENNMEAIHVLVVLVLQLTLRQLLIVVMVIVAFGNKEIE